MLRSPAFQLLIIMGFINAIILYSCQSSFAQSPSEAKTIPVTEIKTKGPEGPPEITLTEVEQARNITSERICGLVVTWIVIVLVVFLVWLQLRDDERLYREGYYPKDTH